MVFEEHSVSEKSDDFFKCYFPKEKLREHFLFIRYYRSAVPMQIV